MLHGAAATDVAAVVQLAQSTGCPSHVAAVASAQHLMPSVAARLQLTVAQWFMLAMASPAPPLVPIVCCPSDSWAAGCSWPAEKAQYVYLQGATG